MTAANVVTSVRIAFVPVLVIVFRSDWQYAGATALGVFIVACVTDALDGFLARRYGQETTLGKLIDPLADKLLIAAAILLLVENGTMDIWPALIVLTREFAVTTLRSVAAAEGKVVGADWSGKVKMVVQVVCVSALLLGQKEMVAMPPEVRLIIAWCMASVTLGSGIVYIYNSRKLFTGGKKA